MILAGCIDLWDSHVTKKEPITLTDILTYGKQIYGTHDLYGLLENTEKGQKYTMVLQVSTTCHKDVSFSFSGEGGWFHVTIPKNSRNVMIAKTDVWKGAVNTKLSTTMTCGFKTMTLHKIALVKGSEPCEDQKGKG